jgi:probable addiction module antidote protein
MLKTLPFDFSEHLDNEEEIAAYLNAAFEDGDPTLIAAALGDVAKAVGMSKIARDAGVARESLYRSLSAEGNPELGTVMKVARSFGLRLRFQALPRKHRRRKVASNKHRRRRAA